MTDIFKRMWKEVRTIRKLFLSVALASLLLGAQAKATQSDIYQDTESYTVYGYCPCDYCCGKSDKLTFTETTAMQDRTIAVDTGIIPLGSTVLIYYEDSLVGIFQAEDIGGDIKGNKIDMYFEKHSDALDWGKKDCEVIVVDAKG